MPPWFVSSSSRDYIGVVSGLLATLQLACNWTVLLCYSQIVKLSNVDVKIGFCGCFVS